MKYIDINKRYSEIVAEYISKGYTINTASMSGTQGEIAKIDLTDGNEIIRISIDGFSNWRESIEGYEITVGRDTKDEVKPHTNDSGYNTIWNNNLEIIHTERFYRIDRYSDFLGTEEDAKNAVAVRRERIKYSRDKAQRFISSLEPNTSAKAIEIAKRIIRRKFGYSRINTSEVKISKDNRGYTVVYRGNVYTLH